MKRELKIPTPPVKLQFLSYANDKYKLDLIRDSVFPDSEVATTYEPSREISLLITHLLETSPGNRTNQPSALTFSKA